MTRVLLLVGSPRGKKSNSTSVGSYLLNILDKRGLETETLWINRQLSDDEKRSQMLDAVDRADIIILTAPLYDDCQPYIVTRAMEAIAARLKNLGNKRFIPIINCGFPEPRHITAVAIAIYQKFAS
ncbi:MAG: NAD(P)H-dependent oxidoreductase, partial [Candidatus Aminicenantes bacterium]